MLVIIDEKTIYLIGILILAIIVSGATLFIKSSVSVTTENKAVGYIALIIDDLGNRAEGTDELFCLEIPLTAAVMPFRPYSRQDAEAAHQAGMEVIMHVPMQPEKGKAEWLGPKGITEGLSQEEITERICQGLEEIRYAAGMNNHMGSKAMQDERIVKPLMEVAKDKNLFFIDSKTTIKSVASGVANDLKVPYLERDVFLDHIKSEAEIRKSLKKLGDIALSRGYAIGIGHVGEQGGKITMEQIKAMIPELEEKGIRFVYSSQLLELSAYKENVKAAERH